MMGSIDVETQRFISKRFEDDFEVRRASNRVDSSSIVPFVRFPAL